MASEFLKSIKRDYYAEERAAEMAKFKIENEKNRVKSKTLSDTIPNKLSELELEIENLKESHEKFKAEAKQIRLENDSKKDAEINRLRKELSLFADRYDSPFFKRVLSVLKEDDERVSILRGLDAENLVEYLSVKPKLQVKLKLYEVVCNYAAESFDDFEDVYFSFCTSAETKAAKILGEIFTPDDPCIMCDVLKRDQFWLGYINDMNEKIHSRTHDY